MQDFEDYGCDKSEPLPRRALLAEIAAEEQTAELRTAIAALIETHGAEAVRTAAAYW